MLFYFLELSCLRGAVCLRFACGVQTNSLHGHAQLNPGWLKRDPGSREMAFAPGSRPARCGPLGTAADAAGRGTLPGLAE